MTTTTDTTAATLAKLAATPVWKAALEEADREQHDRRRAALEGLAIAERERAQAVAEAGKRLPELREAHAEARRRLRAAALALHSAECAASDAECAADARVRHAALPLADLGDNDIAALRAGLAIQQRIAQAADEYRTITEPHPLGGEVSRTIHIDRGGADKLRQIGEALRECDALARDPELSPAAISKRCDELRAAVESGARIARPGDEITFEGNEARAPWAATIRRTIEKYRPYRRR